MNTTTLLRRSRQLATLTRNAFAPGTSSMLHLYELLDAVHRSGLPGIELSELSALVRRPGRAADRVVLNSTPRGGGSGSASEMMALATIAAAWGPANVLEFGTYDGASAWHLWANSPPDCRVTTLDLPAGTTTEGSSDPALQGRKSRPYLPDDPRVRLVEVDSRTWEPDTPGVDFCFIDAGHTYDCVKNDTEKALKVLAPDGLLLWHDAAWRHDGYGVNEYLKQRRAAGDDIRLVQVSRFDYCSIAVRLPAKASGAPA
jgi:predicted O-methyltransferase YrrM